MPELTLPQFTKLNQDASNIRPISSALVPGLSLNPELNCTDEHVRGAAERAARVAEYAENYYRRPAGRYLRPQA